ncbi:MAG: hypothetical protein HZA63_18355 [Rhodocyclales bacterium]|nr:hypothetical protein [Rhodocyclales bacterium]
MLDSGLRVLADARIKASSLNNHKKFTVMCTRNILGLPKLRALTRINQKMRANDIAMENFSMAIEPTYFTGTRRRPGKESELVKKSSPKGTSFGRSRGPQRGVAGAQLPECTFCT